jgi:hypothetical protein
MVEKKLILYSFAIAYRISASFRITIAAQEQAERVKTAHKHHQLFNWLINKLKRGLSHMRTLMAIHHATR